jgi:hypothetical protein
VYFAHWSLLPAPESFNNDSFRQPRKGAEPPGRCLTGGIGMARTFILIPRYFPSIALNALRSRAFLTASMLAG